MSLMNTEFNHICLIRKSLSEFINAATIKLNVLASSSTFWYIAIPAMVAKTQLSVLTIGGKFCFIGDIHEFSNVRYNNCRYETV